MHLVKTLLSLRFGMPLKLPRYGELGISLFISCFEKAQVYGFLLVIASFRVKRLLNDRCMLKPESQKLRQGLKNVFASIC